MTASSLLARGAKLFAVALVLSGLALVLLERWSAHRHAAALAARHDRELVAKAMHIAAELSRLARADREGDGATRAATRDAPDLALPSGARADGDGLPAGAERPGLTQPPWSQRVARLARISHTHVTLWDDTGSLLGAGSPEGEDGVASDLRQAAEFDPSAVLPALPEASPSDPSSSRRVRLPVDLGGEGTGTVSVISTFASGDVVASIGGPDPVSILLLALGMAAGMAVVSSLVGARTARTLTVVATRIAEGDLDARARLGGNDELARLGRALDRLAENLRSTLSELRAERDRQDDILRGMQEGVLLLDRERRVAHVNPALRNLLALSADVVGRMPIEIIRNAGLTELLNDAFDRGEPMSRELELSGPVPARVLVRITPLAGPRGGLLAVFVDVTNVRHLETVRQQFVANASHELRTPIASIHSAAETLNAGAAADPAARERFLGIIARNAARLKHLVEDLLDLSRLESRGFSVPLRPTAVIAVVRSTFHALGEAAERKGIRLVQRVDPELEVQADAQALEHVLSNLIENAIRYCPSGAEVIVSTRVEGDVARLAVSDDGPGIPEEHLSRLFERFYRVDAGRSRELGGTGLGLAIVKHWVEVMNGEVDVESRVGEGSTFTVRLEVASS